jgi:hypothetical protein
MSADVEAERGGGQQHQGAVLADQQQGGEAVGAEQHHAVDLACRRGDVVSLGGQPVRLDCSS